MGKITSPAVEIIPLNENKRNSLINMPYMSDPSIVPRVKQYLESNTSNKTYVDINQMADDLQKEYREYSRRKKSAFRASVKKAYFIVLQSYGLDDKDSSDEALVRDDSDQESETEDKFGNNSMNNTLIDLYQGRKMRPNPEIIKNELIDISSEDSDEEATCNNTKRNNGIVDTVTSQRSVTNNDSSSEGRSRKRKLEAIVLPVKSASKRKKNGQETFQEQKVTFKDIGGMKDVLKKVRKLSLHIRRPDLYQKFRVSPPRGILLHGPPGCGKTLLANAIAGELGVQLITVTATELVAGISGESEQRIRELFERACNAAPCILFIDEIDVITPNRQNAQKQMDSRIVAQFGSCLDGLRLSKNGDQVLVIGAANRPDAIDPTLRRVRRFDREIGLGIPDVKDREDIFRVLSADLPLSPDFDYQQIAQLTPGYVGADLLLLIQEAGMVAIERSECIDTIKEQEKIDHAKKALEEEQKTKKEIIVANEEAKDKQPESMSSAPIIVLDDNEKPPKETSATNMDTFKSKSTPQQFQSSFNDKVAMSTQQSQDCYITMEDFTLALKEVQPSAKREGFVTVPDVTWNDVGSLKNLRELLQRFILGPVRHLEEFKAFGLRAPAGVLLCGPPGCGKTLLAKAIANEAAINFISVKGPELLNMYVGESERAVRHCFEKARNSAPCVIFFDELDSLCPKRSDSREGGATMRVVNQMLTEMDGLETRKGVFLLAATNRPDIIDPAILRPGRLDKTLYVGLPSKEDRADILRAITKNGTRPRLDDDVDLHSLGTSEQLKGYTGADLATLVDEASGLAYTEYMLNPNKPFVVTNRHFRKAVAEIRPSVSEKDQKYYEKLRRIYAAVPKTPEEEEKECAETVIG
ncbi:hypothetical protein ABEB36_001733 [Hypothenemus hampei]|uniref:AAA+ ATPase domain-containing protein n=1 Tax=Hypothenemus hampei TaxID=57062 RepID=A0ABD1FFK2_HYPHA